MRGEGSELSHPHAQHTHMQQPQVSCKRKDLTALVIDWTILYGWTVVDTTSMYSK